MTTFPGILIFVLFFLFFSFPVVSFAKFLDVEIYKQCQIKTNACLARVILKRKKLCMTLNVAPVMCSVLCFRQILKRILRSALFHLMSMFSAWLATNRLCSVLMKQVSNYVFSVICCLFRWCSDHGSLEDF